MDVHFPLKHPRSPFRNPAKTRKELCGTGRNPERVDPPIREEQCRDKEILCLLDFSINPFRIPEPDGTVVGIGETSFRKGGFSVMRKRIVWKKILLQKN
jgi:hypothetical protein